MNKEDKRPKPRRRESSEWKEFFKIPFTRKQKQKEELKWMREFMVYKSDRCIGRVHLFQSLVTALPFPSPTPS